VKRTPENYALTFNNISAELRRITSLSARQRVDLASAVCVVARSLGHADVADAVDPLDRPIGTADEIAHRLKRLRRETDAAGVALKTEISRFRRALHLCGVAVCDGRGDPPLRASWEQLFGRLTEVDRVILLPFAKWASAQAGDVSAMDPVRFAAYAAERFATHRKKSVAQQIRKIASVWSVLRESELLPDIGNPAPNADGDGYCFADADFSPRVNAEFAGLVRHWTTVPRRGHVLT
jgi:hypothetical protein